MKKYLDIKGSTVVDHNGVLLGSVEDCIFDMKSNRICSMIIYSRKQFSSGFILPFKQVCRLGDNIIYKGDAFKLKKKNIIKKLTTLNGLLGKQLINCEGKCQGHMADLLIQEKTGDIKAVVCSRGLIDDIIGGRKLALINHETVLVNQKIIIPLNDLMPMNSRSIYTYIEEDGSR